MPIYDYRCQACRRRFAVFFPSFSKVVAAVRCERCGGEDVARMAPRVARTTSEDERLDRLSDGALGDVDENDPASIARWTKRLGDEMGEDLGDELGEAMDDAGGGEPEPKPYGGADDDL